MYCLQLNGLKYVVNIIFYFLFLPSNWIEGLSPSLMLVWSLRQYLVTEIIDHLLKARKKLWERLVFISSLDDNLLHILKCKLILRFLLQKLLHSMNELEKLKPKVQQKINEFNSRRAYQPNGWEKCHSNNFMDFSPAKKQTLTSYNKKKVKIAWEFALKVVAHQ